MVMEKMRRLKLSRMTRHPHLKYSIDTECKSTVDIQSGLEKTLRMEFTTGLPGFLNVMVKKLPIKVLCTSFVEVNKGRLPCQYQQTDPMTPSNADPRNSISDKRRKYEIAAVFLTGAGKLVFMDLLQWKLLFIIVSIVGWTVYVIYRNRKVERIL